MLVHPSQDSEKACCSTQQQNYTVNDFRQLPKF